MNKLKGQKIVSCRICKGDHWTTRCPYKDTLGPMQKELAEQLGLSTGEKEKLPGGTAPETHPLGFSFPPPKPEFSGRPRFYWGARPFFSSRRAGAGAGSAKQDGQVRAAQPEGRRQPPRRIHAAQPQG